MDDLCCLVLKKMNNSYIYKCKLSDIDLPTETKSLKSNGHNFIVRNKKSRLPPSITLKSPPLRGSIEKITPNFDQPEIQLHDPEIQGRGYVYSSVFL